MGTGNVRFDDPFLVGKSVEKHHCVVVLLSAAVTTRERDGERSPLVSTLSLFHRDIVILLQNILTIGQFRIDGGQFYERNTVLLVIGSGLLDESREATLQGDDSDSGSSQISHFVSHTDSMTFDLDSRPLCFLHFYSE